MRSPVRLDPVTDPYKVSFPLGTETGWYRGKAPVPVFTDRCIFYPSMGREFFGGIFMEFGKEFIYEFAKRTLDNILLLEEEFKKEEIKNQKKITM